LLTVRQLLEKDYFVVFKDKTCEVFDSTNIKLMSIKMKDKSLSANIQTDLAYSSATEVGIWDKAKTTEKAVCVHSALQTLERAKTTEAEDNDTSSPERQDQTKINKKKLRKRKRANKSEHKQEEKNDAKTDNTLTQTENEEEEEKEETKVNTNDSSGIMISDSFSSLSLSEAASKAIADMGFNFMTHIQARAISPLLIGNDMLAKNGCWENPCVFGSGDGVTVQRSVHAARRNGCCCDMSDEGARDSNAHSGEGTVEVPFANAGIDSEVYQGIKGTKK